jgi:D-alanyl-D-alanine carboxypeptidase
LKNAKSSIHIPATNLLLKTYLNKDPYKIVAAKTGSLPEAGYCMAQLTKNAQGNEIVAVELGNDNHFSRYQDIKAMTAWAFETYQWEK